MHTPISVSTLNNQIKSLLETHYMSVFVEGEVSRVIYHGSGHLYFSLKDTNSTLSCVMFKGNNQKLKFRLEDGMKVVISGGINVFMQRGTYQINCQSLQPAGEGELSVAYEQLKKKLLNLGYFEKSNKKQLPKIPHHIALITSKTGAALQDMISITQKRWSMIKITLFDTIVQGDSAPLSITQNIIKADKIGADLIIVGRGGGSIEDLWAFNEEIVADSIHEASTPIISAVGHEIDTSISDLVADFSAPTPSAAMELALPDINEYKLYMDSLRDNYQKSLQNILHKKSQLLTHSKELFRQNSFETKLDLFSIEIENLKTHYTNRQKLNLQTKEYQLSNQTIELQRTVQNILFQKTQQVKSLQTSLENSDPSKKDKDGIAYLFKKNKKVKLENLQEGDTIELQNSKIVFQAKILKKKKAKT